MVELIELRQEERNVLRLLATNDNVQLGREFKHRRTGVVVVAHWARKLADKGLCAISSTYNPYMSANVAVITPEGRTLYAKMITD